MTEGLLFLQLIFLELGIHKHTWPTDFPGTTLIHKYPCSHILVLVSFRVSQHSPHLPPIIQDLHKTKAIWPCGRYHYVLHPKDSLKRFV